MDQEVQVNIRKYLIHLGIFEILSVSMCAKIIVLKTGLKHGKKAHEH